MKIMSFNVNGIKSFTKFIKENFDLSFNDYLLTYLKVDILCLQETKCCKKDMEDFYTLKDYITLSNNNTHKNGIYGVCTIISKKLYCRKHNIKVPYSEYGRSILTDHKNFKILNLYCPFYDKNGTKTKESVIKFYREIYEFIKKFDDLIVLGDLNATYSLYDHYIFYNEYKKVYDRKIDTQIHDIKIIEKFSEIFNNTKFRENFFKVAIRDDTISDNIFIEDKSNLNFLFGKNIHIFFNSYNSPYLKFLYQSIRHLKNLSFSISEDIENEDVDYSINIIEKSYSSQTELPYLVESASTLSLLFYSTYQRKWLLKFILEMTHIDAFRVFDSRNERYSCWNTQLNLRPRNLGSRIDYILVPIKFFNMIIFSDVIESIYGSDHCPVYVNLNIEVSDDKENICKVRNNLLGFLKIKKT
ncbi:exodeoxyribonuclease III AP endonuclease [Vairimorpha necatrix]|uniref:Exodeoxyribonuclease III AP endonuclease n=1 Tax=Vairimorpha necatrix TaxID=6039 RepID=A0AAX4J985_9MICR